MSANGSTEHIRTCHLCEGMCGLRVTVKDGRIEKVRPNPEDVWSRGYICPKGTALGYLHHDPDRLRAPLVRDGDEFREVSWDEAFAEVERRLRAVIETHGMDALTAYIGNPTAHNFSLSRYVAAFAPMSGISPIYSAGTVDQWPKNVSSALLYGGMWTFPLPDIDRTDYLIVMGANPHASQGSLLAAPDVLGRLDAIRERGGKVIVIDPRRTGTADRADEWLAIRPGADAALLLAWAQVLFEEGLVDLGQLAGRVNGVDEVRALCADFTPEAVAETCGMAAGTIRRIAREFAAADTAAVYGRIGLCTQEFGTLASWLVDVLNVLTGNLDKPGGAMFGKPLAWSFVTLRPPEFAEGFEFGRWKSRVRGAPEVLGQVPVSCLAEEIVTPGEGQIKALVMIAGNPVLSAPDAGQLDAALPELECMIAVDNYLNETTRHADVILPGLSPFEQPHYDELIWAWAIRSAGKYSPTLFEPEEGRPAEWQILLTLAAIIQGQPAAEVDTDALDQLFFSGLVAMLTQREGSAIEGRDPGEITAQAGEPGPERLLDLTLRTGPWGDAYGANSDGLTLAKLKQEPNGIDMGPLVPRLDEVLETVSGKIELAHDYILGDAPRLRERLAREEEPLVLVSRRDVRSNNSWMHNVPSLMTGKDRCTLLIHPDDAGSRGLEAGKMACITSQAGSLQVAVEISDEMMPGVVCLPHGWGHDKPGARLEVAAAHAGVCNNLLAPGELVDVLSGNAIVNGIPVEVAPV
ncbi:MAG: molybdopterin-dependent oxidoreductase [Deltaproteobacteria bacterium]|nr:molybdopterin-dependent oxidoreductase [Deltaproteobacteria bacterium]